MGNLLRKVESMKSRIDKTEYKFKTHTLGSMFWYKNGGRHRDKDLPAIIFRNGTMHWFKNNKPHRDNNKPAVIYHDGTMFWYIDGKFIKEYKK